MIVFLELDCADCLSLMLWDWWNCWLGAKEDVLPV